MEKKKSRKIGQLIAGICLLAVMGFCLLPGSDELYLLAIITGAVGIPLILGFAFNFMGKNWTLPFLAFFLGTIGIPLYVFGHLTHFSSGWTLLLIILAPIVGLILGGCSLGLKKEDGKRDIVALVLSVLGIAIPSLTVVIMICLTFSGFLLVAYM